MNKHRFLLRSALSISLLSALLCSCNEEEDAGIDANLQIYGMTYEVGTGIVWQSNPYRTYERVPFYWDDTFDENGQQVVERVEGFYASEQAKESGNFMISIYQSGMNFNEQLSDVDGWGAVACFHLASKEPERLVPGNYTIGGDQTPGTFKGYASSSYNGKVGGGIATITEGTVKVNETPGGYTVSFDCKTDFGGIVKGYCNVPLRLVRLPQVSSLEFNDLHLEGLLKKYIKHLATKAEPDVMPLPQWNLNPTGLDIFSKAFLSLAGGTISNANGSKSTPDIALSYDDDRQELMFESPLHMRRFFGLKARRDFYTFPCHTIYMKAPDSFTDADFDKVTETGLTADVKEETVRIPIGDNFKPCYVFFRTGRGAKGVIRVRGFREAGKTYTPYPYSPMHVITESRPASLTIDVKCPAVIYNPAIK